MMNRRSDFGVVVLASAIDPQLIFLSQRMHRAVSRAGRYFTCLQARKIVSQFPEHLPHYRSDAIISLFSRIIDLENFDLLVELLPKARPPPPVPSHLRDMSREAVQKRLALHDRAALVHRLGLLNIMNPFKCDQPYDLELSRSDEHAVAKVMVGLAVVEPGVNFVEGETLFNRGPDKDGTRAEDTPGWT